MKPTQSASSFNKWSWALAVVAFASAVLFLNGCAHQESPTITTIPGRAAASKSAAAYSYEVAKGTGRFYAFAPIRNPEPREEFPGSVPSPDEELWIITRPPHRQAPMDDSLPRFGTLMTKVREKEVAIPLRHTEVQGTLSGYIASVRVTQQFHNPYDGKIEAKYVFPLPENSAVNEFVMVIGERRIRGLIREREEAEKTYQEAKAQGHVASLLTQERPNIFSQSVANIEPGKAIEVSIRYFHTLACVDGWHEFVFPMVVGPRYNPPKFREGVGAVARGSGGASGQKTEVQYLAPGETTDAGVSLQLDLIAPVEEHRVTSHRMEVTQVATDRTRFRFANRSEVPNKDFVLRYRLAGETIKSQLLTHRDERGGYFNLMLMPPANLKQLARGPLELVFVLDCSGSMNGRPIQQAKAAVAHALRQLEPQDTFQLINFSSHASQLGSGPLPATQANLQRGQHYLASLNAEGGTEMIHGIKAALNYSHDPQRLRFVCFLTDGYIGNEADILREVNARIRESRIFSFGVGDAPNRYLLDAMAKVGRGAVAYLSLEDYGAKVMDDFFDRIAHPALTDVQIDWGGLEVSEVYPRRVPDLFTGRMVTLAGRFNGKGEKTVRITGRAGGTKFELPMKVNLNANDPDHKALPSIWARQKIAALYDEATWRQNFLVRREVRQLALDYSLLSAYTAFVAVDGSARTAGRSGTTVPVPVPVPEGVKYKTTVK
jgi:Ca-activated chloride channel family protein